MLQKPAANLRLKMMMKIEASKILHRKMRPKKVDEDFRGRRGRSEIGPLLLRCVNKLSLFKIDSVRKSSLSLSIGKLVPGWSWWWGYPRCRCWWVGLAGNGRHWRYESTWIHKYQCSASENVFIRIWIHFCGCVQPIKCFRTFSPPLQIPSVSGPQQDERDDLRRSRRKHDGAHSEWRDCSQRGYQ